MAKQLVGPVERHIEKGAVGIAGLLLIGVVARYLVTSPNQLELGGDLETPSTVDERVARKAEDVSNRIQSARPEELAFEPFYDDMLAVIDPFEAAKLPLELPAGAPFGPEVPIIDTPEVIEGQRTLVDVIRLPRPEIIHGRTMFDVRGVPSVRNWATVSAVFDRKEQANRQASAYGAAVNEVVFGPIELQRRARRPDGSWHDEDWGSVDLWPYPKLPKIPTISMIERDGQPVVAPEDFDRIINFSDRLSEPSQQLGMLRPLMPPRMVGTKWEFPVITAYEDVIKQDNEYLNPDGEGSEARMEDRYGLRDIDLVTEEAEELTGAARIEALFESGKELLATARTVDEAVDAYNIFQTIIDDSDSSSLQKNRARKLRADADQKMKDIKRESRHPTRSATPTEDVDEEVRRVLLPIQQVWAHDAAPDGVVSGQTYQYRMRILLLNRLAGEPPKFKDPEDATVVFIEGPWSPPSEPVTIEPDRQFFVTGCDARKRTAKVEMYRWFEGVWVESRQTFEVGDQLVNVTRVEVPDPEDPEEVDRPEVRFDAKVTVVDIDFDRDYRPRNTVRGGGVKFPASPDSVCSVVLVDEAGRLQERLDARDKSDPARRDRARQVWKPPS